MGGVSKNLLSGIFSRSVTVQFTSFPETTVFDVFNTIWRYRKRFAATALAIFAAVLAYAFFAPPIWQGSQAMIVHNDLEACFSPLPSTSSEDRAKTTQQTLQEMACSSSLLASALRRVGPPDNADPAAKWPSGEVIEDLRNQVSLAPPKGTEVGKSEVLYLKVKDRNRQRALQLTDAIYAELERAFGEVRATVARSQISQLTEAVNLRERNLAEVTRRVAEIEKRVGVDLVSLRMLHQMPSGDTHLYRELTGAVEELRQNTATENQRAALLEMLKKAEQNPLLMAAAPKELLDCHPGLARLIQGLSESRLRGFAGASRLTEQHPDMRVIRAEEEGIREGLREELAAAIQGVTAAQQISAARRATLQSQIDEFDRRLGRLADVRSEYSNLVAQVEQRRNLVEEARRNLAQAGATFSAATLGSVLSRMDLPDGGVRPVSPGRKMLALCGLLGGILGGVGVVLLTAPVARREDVLLEPGEPSVVSRTLPARAGRNGHRRLAEPAPLGPAESPLDGDTAH
jgi:uncharacterized protein involved in exopolysaccharide biosynthesis